MPNPSIVHPKRAERARGHGRTGMPIADSEHEKHNARLCACACVEERVPPCIVGFQKKRWLPVLLRFLLSLDLSGLRKFGSVERMRWGRYWSLLEDNFKELSLTLPPEL